MYPSIDTIKNGLNVTREQARFVRQAMEAETSDHEIMRRIDDIIHTHGVEYIPKGHNQKSPAIDYCNTGDPYITTVLLVNGRFRIGCWGDIVERGNYD